MRAWCTARPVIASLVLAALGCGPGAPVEARVTGISLEPGVGSLRGSFDLELSAPSGDADVWLQAAQLSSTSGAVPIGTLEGDPFPIEVGAAPVATTVHFLLTTPLPDAPCAMQTSAWLTGTLYDEAAATFVPFGSPAMATASRGPEGARSFVALGGPGIQVAEDVALDATGAAFVLGLSSGVADLGGGPLDAGTAMVPFVAKLDAQGQHVWSRLLAPADAWSSAPGIGIRRLVIDPQGNLVIVGSYEGTLDFGGGPLPSAGGQDVFVAKLSAAGEHLWSKRVGNALMQTVFAAGVDDAGGVVLAGTFAGAVDFGGGMLGPVGEPDWSNVFLAHFDAAGEHLSSANVAAVESATSGFVGAVDASGGVVIAGSYSGEARHAGVVEEAAQQDALLLAFDGQGTPRFSRVLRDAQAMLAAVAIDTSGDILTIGTATSQIEVGTGIIPATAAFSFVLRLDSKGEYLAHAAVPGVLGGAVDLAADPTGIVVSGATLDGVALPGSSDPAAPLSQAFVLWLDPSGAPRRALGFGCGSHAPRVASAPPSAGSQDVALFGTLAAPLMIEGDIVVPIDGSDTFLARLPPP